MWNKGWIHLSLNASPWRVHKSSLHGKNRFCHHRWKCGCHPARSRCQDSLDSHSTTGPGYRCCQQSSVSPTKQINLNAHVMNIILKIVSNYQCWHVLEYVSPDLYGLPLCKQEHVSAATHPLWVMSSKTVPWQKHNDTISLVCKVNCSTQYKPH